MKERTLTKNMEETIWVARTLFDRGKVSGSTANISFRYEDKIYISSTGSCFGQLTRDAFSVVNLDGVILSNVKPSKEINMHKSLYEMYNSISAVIHTHSTYATYWSCILEGKEVVKIPTPTPYLSMKVGEIGWVPYARPGSKELFKNFESACLKRYRAYILENHGVIVAGESMMEAFYMLEELEEAAKNAWLLQISSLLK